jgi:peroxiredoxin
MDNIPSRRQFAVIMLAFIMVTSLPVFAGVQIGEKITGIQLRGSDGKVFNLEEYSGKIVILEFWSFKCPVTAAYNERIGMLQSKYRNRGIAVFAVASNKNESPIEVERNRENLSLPFPVLLDPDGMFADRLGATHTPSVVIVDGSGTLRYRGAIDNNKRPGEQGRIPHVEDAVEALLAGRPVPQAETKVFGCSIKR